MYSVVWSFCKLIVTKKYRSEKKYEYREIYDSDKGRD